MPNADILHYQLQMNNIMAIIPAFNESKNICNIIDKVKRHVSIVLVIDDGSTDDTFTKAKIANIKVLRNSRNRGKGYTIKKGLLESFRYSPNI